MLSYSRYIEYCRKFCKLVVTSAIVDWNDLTAFTIRRNSVKFDVLIPDRLIYQCGRLHMCVPSTVVITYRRAQGAVNSEELHCIAV
jgi:hypothetical protein